MILAQQQIQPSINNYFLNDDFDRATLSTWTENDPNSTLTIAMSNPGVTLSVGAFTIASRNITYNTAFNSNVKSFEMTLRVTPTSAGGGVAIGMRNNTQANPSRWVGARISQSPSPISLEIWSGNGGTNQPDEQTQRAALTTSIAVTNNLEYVLKFVREYNGLNNSALYTATVALYNNGNHTNVPSVQWVETNADTQSQSQITSMRPMVSLVNGTYRVNRFTCELLN